MGGSTIAEGIDKHREAYGGGELEIDGETNTVLLTVAVPLYACKLMEGLIHAAVC
jgi:hypothetical protein